MRMRRFPDPLEQPLSGGYALHVEAAGEASDGRLDADLRLWNGRAKHSQRVRLGHEGQQRAFVRSVRKVAPALTEPELIAALAALGASLPGALSSAASAGAEPADDGTDPYPLDGGRICWRRRTEGGEVLVPLANFDARIVAEVVTDDGAEERGAFEIEGALADGRPLAAARVPFPQFPVMNWVIASWGARAVVSAGQGAKDRLREAIQLRSGDVPRRRVYEHTGWRRIDGALVYLTANGGIGAGGVVEGVDVELTGAAARVALPAPPEGDELRGAVEASLALWRLLPASVAAPTLGAVYLAPLREFMPGAPPDFTLWEHGPSGAFKSEIGALAQAHYGPEFTRTTLPTFTATANAIERLTFTLKDALCVIDDYHPAQDHREAQAMQSVASRLLRGVGNGSGRPRMNADTRLRPDLPPRCVPLATGERLPQGHSTAARLMPVPIERGDVDPVALAAVQTKRELLSAAMAGYVRWLAADADRLEREIPDRFRRFRDAAQGHGTHTREPSQVAYLFLGVDSFLRFAAEAGAIDAHEQKGMRDAAWSALLDLAAGAGDALASETPVQRFLALLGDGIASRRVYLEDLEGGAPDVPEAWGWETHTYTDQQGEEQTDYRHGASAQLLGRVDDRWLYLLPEATYGYVASAARAAGEVFPVELKTLLKRLDEAKLIATAHEGVRVRRTPNVSVGGHTHRFIKLSRAALRPPVAQDGELGEYGEAEPSRSSTLPQDASPKPSADDGMGKPNGEAARSNGGAIPPIPRIPHSRTGRDAWEPEDARTRAEWASSLLAEAERLAWPSWLAPDGRRIKDEQRWRAWVADAPSGYLAEAREALAEDGAG